MLNKLFVDVFLLWVFFSIRREDKMKGLIIVASFIVFYYTVKMRDYGNCFL